MDESRTCRRCETERPIWHFARWASSRDHWCRACKKGDPAGWKKESNRRDQILRKYHLWYPDDVEALSARFDGACWMCGRTDRRQVIDHCHDTGRFRGIICGYCNSGTTGDDLAHMKRRIAYLERPLPKAPIRQSEPTVNETDHVLYNRYRDLGTRFRAQGFTPPEWLYFEGFVVWSEANGWAPTRNLLRYDTQGSFEPANCRWSDDWRNAACPAREVYFSAWGSARRLSEWLAEPRDPRVKVKNRALFYSRMGKGWSVEEALGLTTEEGKQRSVDASRKPRKRYSGFGKELTIPEWIEDPRRMVPPELFRARIERKWSVEDALTITVEEATARKGRYSEDRSLRVIECFGEKKYMRDWPKDPRCEPGYKTLDMRITELGWEPERAISTPVRKRRSRAEIEGHGQHVPMATSAAEGPTDD